MGEKPSRCEIISRQVRGAVLEFENGPPDEPYYGKIAQLKALRRSEIGPPRV